MFNRMPFPGKKLAGGIASFLLLFATQVGATGNESPGIEIIKDPADKWDYVWTEVLMDISITGILFAFVALYLIFQYRRRTPDQVGTPLKLTPRAAIGWTLIPVFLIMADDFFLAASGWQLWNLYRQVPANRMEIQLESGMYSWDYTYPNGVQVQNKLRVPAGKPIMLRMTSRDTIHSHFIPDFRVKEDSMPGRITYLWFYPQNAGEHVITCAEYCGIMHSYMAGKLIIMPQEQFNNWYNGEADKLAKKETNNVALQGEV
jgi:cytochrome c oxidase subunit 2